jgi:ectoine hydroxylase-related dioxygenase (phytanoyl-CoA dioxygenase family)
MVSLNDKTRRINEDGYVIFSSVFSRDEINKLRQASLEILPAQSPPFLPQYVSSIFDRSNFLRDQILGNPKLISALKTVLGDDFVLLDEYGLQDSSYSPPHADTSSLEINGYKFHLNDDFLVIQCAIYLQDNGPNGGGLSVVPKSHKLKDIFADCQNIALVKFKLSRIFLRILREKVYKTLSKSMLRRILTRTLRALRRAASYKWSHSDSNTEVTSKCYSLDPVRPSFIPLKSIAGEVVCFNLRLWHEATPASSPPLR